MTFLGPSQNQVVSEEELVATSRKRLCEKGPRVSMIAKRTTSTHLRAGHVCAVLSQYSTLTVKQSVSAGSSLDNVPAVALRRTLTSHGCLLPDRLLERLASRFLLQMLCPGLASLKWRDPSLRPVVVVEIPSGKPYLVKAPIPWARSGTASVGSQVVGARSADRTARNSSLPAQGDLGVVEWIMQGKLMTDMPRC